jgi:predicted esterase
MPKTMMAGLTALALMVSQGHAQELDFIFVESPTLLPTFVQVPDGFDRNRTYSVVVALHGFGASPQTFLDATRDIARAGYILASVAAPYQFRVDDSLVGYDWSYRHLNQAAVSQRATQLSVDYIVAAVAGLRTSYQIDKVFLLGFSQGGAFSYLTSSVHPEVIDGLIALGSRFDAAWFEGRPPSDFPVFIGHGERESERSVAGAHAARDFLQAAGHDVTLRMFDVGHDVPREMVAGIIEWLGGQ